jgi:hypothetical protein
MLRDVEGMMVSRRGGGDLNCRVKVLNISGGGAALLATEPLRVGESLHLTLPSKPEQGKPIEGRAIDTRSDPSGGWVIHVQFVQWVPLGPYLEAQRQRHRWERSAARESRASVTWQEGATEKAIRGDLLNICVGGAAFLGDDLPPAGIPIWLQLEDADHPGFGINGIEGRLRMSSFDPSGRRVAHIDFVSSCPADFFFLATRGSR